MACAICIHKYAILRRGEAEEIPYAEKNMKSNCCVVSTNIYYSLEVNMKQVAEEIKKIMNDSHDQQHGYIY